MSKSIILYMVCAMRSSENTESNSIEEWLHIDVCVMWASSRTDIVSAAVKQKHEEGEDENENHTAVRTSSKTSQKQMASTDYFSK
jgi:sarcosine oxidase delta subunit